MQENKLIIQKIDEERKQGLETRVELYNAIEKQLGVPVISYFTSFVYPVMIEDNDADMLEGLLQKCDTCKGFAMILSSPGGSGLAAERIINVCRSYSGNGNYSVIIPGKAKSAATMICFGASKIVMSETSELGPIDPQLVIELEGEGTWFSIYNIVKSYRELFNAAVKTKGNLQPFLQQLENYDSREITEYESQLALSEDIAVKALKSGMMSRMSEETIRKNISIFLTPERTKVHGRPIYAEEAKNCKLEVELKDLKDSLWSDVYELYARINTKVSLNNVAKCVECKDNSFIANALIRES